MSHFALVRLKEKSMSSLEISKCALCWYFQVVSHPSTDLARPCLALEIRQDRACSGWYGHKWWRGG